jgi:hypothetical protein
MLAMAIFIKKYKRGTSADKKDRIETRLPSAIPPGTRVGS